MRPRATANPIDDFVAVMADDRSRINALELVAHRHSLNLNPEPWIAPALLGTWANVAGQQPMEYRRWGDTVWLRGLVGGGGAGTNIFNLPVGYRPPFNLGFAVPAGLPSAFGQIVINAAGGVQHGAGAVVLVNVNLSFSIS